MTSYLAVNILGGLLIVTSLLVVLSKTPQRATLLYSLQSMILVALLVALGVTTGSRELFTWAVTAFITKAVLVPGIMLFALRKIGADAKQAVPSAISPVVAIILVAVELFLCFIAVNGIGLPTAVEVKPALAVSLAHFFVGLTCIITQRNILKQVFGYCLMENGSHVTLALLAPEAPGLVEIGIATDAIFAVVIMAIVAVRIHKVVGSLDADDLRELKG
ncbi:MAG: hydrogenase 4 membrane subunit [Coriobacteriales bacterium]|jgi:hydrogenase-4 component E|nr:hydrogenase 4 membrane subunit [Coriobacteriales bacterium]